MNRRAPNASKKGPGAIDPGTLRVGRLARPCSMSRTPSSKGRGDRGRSRRAKAGAKPWVSGRNEGLMHTLDGGTPFRTALKPPETSFGGFLGGAGFRAYTVTHRHSPGRAFRAAQLVILDAETWAAILQHRVKCLQGTAVCSVLGWHPRASNAAI